MVLTVERFETLTAQRVCIYSMSKETSLLSKIKWQKFERMNAQGYFIAARCVII